MKRPILPHLPLSVKTYMMRNHMHTHVGWHEPQMWVQMACLNEWTHRGLCVGKNVYHVRCWEAHA